jgi:regulator of sigma E protease
MLLSIVAAVAIFAILIVVHEAGHFVVAKRLGIRVLRFSIGYPPRIFGIRRGETDYAFGATPFGGYVRMLGDEIADEPSAETIKSYLKEVQLDLIGAARSTKWLTNGSRLSGAPAPSTDELDSAFSQNTNKSLNDLALNAIAAELEAPDNEKRPDVAIAALGRPTKPDEDLLLRKVYHRGSVALALEELSNARPAALLAAFNARAFPSQPLAKRFAIVLAGPFSNLLFAPFLMMIVFMVGVPTLLPVVGKAKKDMPAFVAGLRQGDDITAIDGKKMATWDDLSDAVKASDGAPLHLTVLRPEGQGRHAVELTVVPKRMLEESIYGNRVPTWVIGVSPRGDKITRSYGPLQAIRAGGTETARMLVTLCIGIGKIFDGATPVRQALAGPVMIAQIAGKEAHQGFADVALFTVMLSLELGIINLLPVPLLDGGHLLFFSIEAVRGKPLQLRHREIAMQVGLFLLVVLMAFAILNDISHIVG